MFYQQEKSSSGSLLPKRVNKSGETKIPGDATCLLLLPFLAVTCGTGDGFAVSSTSGVPEPTSLALTSMDLIGLPGVPETRKDGVENAQDFTGRGSGA